MTSTDTVHVITPNPDNSTTWWSPDQLDQHIAQAEAQAARFRDRKAALDEARRVASRAEHLNALREASGDGVIECNRARSAAEEQFEEIANADTLDVAELQAAFIAVLDADARCGAIDLYVSLLDNMDPLPPHPTTGAPQRRERRTSRRYQNHKWSTVLDEVLLRRAAAASSRYQQQLEDDEEQRIDRATEKAYLEALGVEDFDRLDVPQPTPIRQLHAQAVADIDEDQFDPEKVGAAGLGAVRHKASQDALAELAESGH